MYNYENDKMKKKEDILEAILLICASDKLSWDFNPGLWIFFDCPFIFTSLPWDSKTEGRLVEPT